MGYIKMLTGAIRHLFYALLLSAIKPIAKTFFKGIDSKKGNYGMMIFCNYARILQEILALTSIDQY